MVCCCEPAGLTYLRNLLGRRQDIAVHPADALDQPQPPPDLYFYRPGEILVPFEQLPLLEEAAKSIGVRVTQVGADDRRRPRPTAPTAPEQPATERIESTTPIGEPIGSVRVAVLARDGTPTVLAALERASGGRLRVSPNHVLFSCPGWGFEPEGDPEPIPEVPDPRGSRRERREEGHVPVAVVDSGLPTGFDANPLLADVVVPYPVDIEQWPYTGPLPVLTFPEGHGSAVVGVVAATSAGAVIAAYMTLDKDGVTDEWFLGTQVGLALDGRPAVLNLSLGGYTRHDRPLLGLAHLQADTGNGTAPFIVAAAGNCGDGRPFYPAANDWVVAVGAAHIIEHLGVSSPARAWFSNLGPWVDVWAPGVGVHTAYEAHPYQPRSDPTALRFFEGGARWSGTSFAAPSITGRIADLLAEEPGLDRAAVLARLLASSTGLVDNRPYVPHPS